MDGESLAMLFGVNYHVLKVNTNDLTHEDSLLQPSPGGNCLNWVLGHIIALRNRILQLVGEEPIWNDAQTAAYKRGSPPVTDATRARRFEEMLADLDRSQALLMEGLARLSPEALSASDAEGTLGEKLAMLQFHEAYHAGQVGFLRRLAGKKGAIQ